MSVIMDVGSAFDERFSAGRQVRKAMTAGPGLRCLRALMLAGVALATGVFAHVSAGGYLPGAAGLVTLWLLAGAAVAPLLGRQASTTRVVVLLVAGQTFVHVVLTALGGHRGDPTVSWPASSPVSHPAIPVAPTGRRTGSFYDQVARAPAGGGHVEWTTPHWVQHLVADLTGPHALMALAHLGAAAAVGWWLAAGERALWTLLTVTSRPLLDRCRFLFAHAFAGVGAVVVASGAARLWDRRTGWAALRPACAVFLFECLTRRGPPPVPSAA
jgi:hypothetical protein